MATDVPALAEQFDDLEQQHGADRLGMWVFLTTELLLFGALFAGYFAYRTWYAYDFEAGGEHLNVLIGGINTVVLLGSSLTMALSVHAAEAGKRRALVWNLSLTAALGAAFLAFKAYEYYTDYRDNLVPMTTHFHLDEWTSLNPPADPSRVALFLSFYYIMTGLHAVHLTIGIGLVGWLIHAAVRGRIPPDRAVRVEVIGLYWHFVDLVWIFLLPILYLTGTHTISDLHF